MVACLRNSQLVGEFKQCADDVNGDGAAGDATGVVALVVPMVRVLQVMHRALVSLVMPMVRVLWVICRVMARVALSAVWVLQVM